MLKTAIASIRGLNSTTSDAGEAMRSPRTPSDGALCPSSQSIGLGVRRVEGGFNAKSERLRKPAESPD
jgi:hypothetical protein